MHRPLVLSNTWVAEITARAGFALISVNASATNARASTLYAVAVPRRFNRKGKP